MSEGEEPHNTDRESEVEITEGPGAILRKRRVALGMSEQEVMAQLGLTPRVFSALEADDSSRLPATTFVRGYVKRYASILEMSCDGVLNAFQHFYGDQLKREVYVPPTPPARNYTRKYISVGICVVLLLVLILWVSQSSGGQGSGVLSRAFAQPPIIAQSALQSAPSRAGSKQPEQLLVTLDQDNWLEVVDAEGNILLVDYIEAGKTRLLYGTAPFQIQARSPESVWVTYQNRQQPLAKFDYSETRYTVGR